MVADGEETKGKKKGGRKAQQRDERSALRAQIRRSSAEARRAARRAASDARAARNRITRAAAQLTPWELAQWRRHERRHALHEAFARYTKKAPWHLSRERNAARNRSVT